MNGVCGSCGKPEHPGGCKLPDLPPKRDPPLVDPDFEAKRDASFEGRQWKPPPKEEGVLGQSYHPDVDDNPNQPEKIKLDVTHFHHQMIDLLVECVEVQRVKGGDYTQKSNDRLTNFKRASQKWGITIEQAWGVLYGKHADAVETYVKFGQVESEPIRGRIVDCINYLLLLWLIVREKDPNQD